MHTLLYSRFRTRCFHGIEHAHLVQRRFIPVLSIEQLAEQRRQSTRPGSRLNQMTGREVTVR